MSLERSAPDQDAPSPQPTPAAGVDLSARIALLEEERRRAFTEAQREADTMFAQYQLSQLLASGDELDKLAPAVLAEIARSSGAGSAAVWLAEPGGEALRLTATVAEGAPMPPPDQFANVQAAARWAGRAGWSGATLEESRAFGGGTGRVAVGWVGVRAPEGELLDPAHVRYLGLVRRELALAFRGAQLRGALARERGTLAAILDGASDAIVAVGPDRRITRLNRAATRLVGGAARDAVGASCEAFLGCVGEIPDPDRPAIVRACGRTCPFADVLEHGRPLVREHLIRTADGETIPVAASYSPMAGEAGGAVAVIRDLRAARALDELKASFLATVSHELRTPLALISGHSQSLLHLSLDPSATRHHLERIDDAVQRLGALVDEILDVGRLENDQLVLERRPTDLGLLLRAFAAEQGELPGSPTIVVEEAELPLVDVDPARIRQVLANLLANTAKYGGPNAAVRVTASQQGAASVLVTFADDGVGIDSLERGQVFERFHRGRGVRESSVPGSGLGLYICRRLVEAHGGWIRLDSGGSGTSITFRLPVTPR